MHIFSAPKNGCHKCCWEYSSDMVSTIYILLFIGCHKYCWKDSSDMVSTRYILLFIANIK